MISGEQTTFLKFTGKINRRGAQDEGDFSQPILRENWLCRDGVLKKPQGHESKITDLTDIPRWMTRYQTIEPSSISPKTFVYCEDGEVRLINDQAGTSSTAQQNFNPNANPRSWLFKNADQVEMYFVDEERLWKYDGNNSNLFENVTLQDSDGNNVNPIDVIEHRDRLFVLSRTKMFVSKNLEPTNFTDASDSLEIIIGSGKGENVGFGKIEDKLYIFTTEGIYVLEGDVISALAATFEVRLIDEKRCVAKGSIQKVERALLFVADDFELWSFNGAGTEMLSFDLKLKDFMNTSTIALEKCRSIYHNNYYKLSFVAKGDYEPNIEIWWDAFEDKIDIVKGRHVSCYMKTDATVEEEYIEIGHSDANIISRDEQGYNYRGSAIVTRLRTRDINIDKSRNVRVTAFYFNFQPTGNRNIDISYLLDGRSSSPAGAGSAWSQNLLGETKVVNSNTVINQATATGRVRPKINYARGASIAFEIIEQTLDVRANFVGIGIDFITKDSKKAVTIGA